MVKFLIIGGLHFKKEQTSTSDLVVAKLTEKIKETKPELVVFLGNTLDTYDKIDQNAQNKAVRFFKEISVLAEVIVIIGSRDRPNSNVYLTDESSFYALKGFPRIHIVDRVISMKYPLVQNGETIRIVCVPYVPNGQFHAALDTLKDKILDPKSRPAIIFCHQEFKGAKIGKFISNEGDEWSADNPLIISGLIKTFQQIGKNLIYSGTPYQLSYDDETAKGVLMVEFLPNGQSTANFLPINIRKKRIITLKPADLNTFVAPTDVDLQIDIVATSDEIKDLTARGVITAMQGKGISVCLTPIRDTNPNNPGNKPFKVLLTSMLGQDTDALNILNEVIAPKPAAVNYSVATESISDIMSRGVNLPTNPISMNADDFVKAMAATPQQPVAATPINIAPSPIIFTPPTLPVVNSPVDRKEAPLNLFSPFQPSPNLQTPVQPRKILDNEQLLSSLTSSAVAEKQNSNDAITSKFVGNIFNPQN